MKTSHLVHALVTGATGGIGRGICLALIRQARSDGVPIRISAAASQPGRRLDSLLDELRELPYEAQGYGPANLIALLRVQRGHLSGLDLSRLCLRGVYL